MEITLQRYLIKINEWVECMSEGRLIYQHIARQRSEQKEGKYFSVKRKITCYPCWKLGHVSRDCRTRIASETQNTTPVQTKEVTTTPSVESSSRPDRKTVVCFTCHQKGHKSPQCPQNVTRVKRIQIPLNKIVPLADITVVPEECVRSDEFTGDTCTVDTFNKVKVIGKRCNVRVQVEDRVFVWEAVTQPGAGRLA